MAASHGVDGKKNMIDIHEDFLTWPRFHEIVATKIATKMMTQRSHHAEHADNVF